MPGPIAVCMYWCQWADSLEQTGLRSGLMSFMCPSSRAFEQHLLSKLTTLLIHCACQHVPSRSGESNTLSPTSVLRYSEWKWPGEVDSCSYVPTESLRREDTICMTCHYSYSLIYMNILMWLWTVIIMRFSPIKSSHEPMDIQFLYGMWQRDYFHSPPTVITPTYRMLWALIMQISCAYIT